MHRVIRLFLDLLGHSVAEDIGGKVLIEELWALGYIKQTVLSLLPLFTGFV